MLHFLERIISADFLRLSSLINICKRKKKNTTGDVHMCLCIFVSTHMRTPVHLSMATRFVQSTVCVDAGVYVRWLAYVSTYPFARICVMWCGWCVVVKHIFLQAISFAYLSQPVHWVSGSLMHTVFNWQLWYSWSPTVMVRCLSSAVALADRHHIRMKIKRSTYLSMCVCTCVWECADM